MPARKTPSLYGFLDFCVCVCVCVRVCMCVCACVVYNFGWGVRRGMFLFIQARILVNPFHVFVKCNPKTKHRWLGLKKMVCVLQQLLAVFFLCWQCFFYHTEFMGFALWL